MEKDNKTVETEEMVNPAETKILDSIREYKEHLDKDTKLSFFEARSLFEDFFEQEMIAFAKSMYNTGLQVAAKIAKNDSEAILSQQFKK